MRRDINICLQHIIHYSRFRTSILESYFSIALGFRRIPNGIGKDAFRDSPHPLKYMVIVMFVNQELEVATVTVANDRSYAPWLERRVDGRPHSNRSSSDTDSRTALDPEHEKNATPA